MRPSAKKILLPLVLLLLGAAGGYALFKSRRTVPTVAPETLAPLVRVVVAETEDIPLLVRAQGTVLPRTETLLISQVAGKVTWVSPAFEVGAFFRRGETLLRLDPRDYELAVKGADAQVAQAEVQLARVRAEAELAREEWAELGEGEPGPLVLREPQLAEAGAAVAAAEAALARARLDLERTRFRAPFDGRLRRKSAGLGQFLAPGQQVASLHAIDYAEVRLPVEDEELAFLELPIAYRDRAAEAGPEVVLRAEFAGGRHAWRGRIVRSEGELDPRSRLLALVARVEDPYASSTGDSARPPLAVGLFVEAAIEGRVVEDAVALPRSALRSRQEGDHVLVVDAAERLRFRPVEVLRLERERVILSRGVEDGERVCISPLDVAVDGMEVRVAPRIEETPRAAEAGS